MPQTNMAGTNKQTVRRTSIGVDVGTGSVRAGAVDVATGALLAVVKRDITTWSTLPEHHTQSAGEIWEAVCTAVRGAIEAAGIRPEDVVGLAFDATCSLVCVDVDELPVKAVISEQQASDLHTATAQ